MYMGGGVLDREVAGDVFKQKTAYEVRISDGSSDVCSSDLNFQIAKMVNSTAPMIAHGKHPPQRPRFFRDGAASAGGGPEGGAADGGGGVGGGVSPVEAPVGLMLFTWRMITKKRLLARATIAMLGAWQLTQAGGPGMRAEGRREGEGGC